MPQAITTIAPHTRIQGELRLEGPGVIAGQVQGNVTAAGPLEIGAEGVIDGDIRGTAVTIHGTVKGNIEAAQDCQLGATARVAGNLCASDLAIAKGAKFIGQVCVGEMEATGAETGDAGAEPNAGEWGGLRPSGAREEAAAMRAVEATLTRVDRPAAPRAEPVPAIPTMMTIPAAPTLPTVGVLAENVQATLHRAPRIIKAR